MQNAIQTPTTFAEMPTVTYTAWGAPDNVQRIAEGIAFVTTPSHGGYVISAERLAAMPEHLRRCSWTKDNHFEEDCSWCAVVLAWPDLFAAEHVKQAKATYDGVYKLKALAEKAPVKCAAGYTVKQDDFDGVTVIDGDGLVVATISGCTPDFIHAVFQRSEQHKDAVALAEAVLAWNGQATAALSEEAQRDAGSMVRAAESFLAKVAG
jgi:hypothetical protein